jgi:hypothetical protein
MRRVLVLVLVFAAATAHADAEYRARVELSDKTGAHHATVTSKRTCSVPAKCPEWTLDLGPADSADLIRVVDLRGEPMRVRSGDSSSDSNADPSSLPDSAKWPAAFVRTVATDAANTRWERWAIVSLEGGRTKLLWRGELAMTPAKGGGFATSDGIELVATEPGQPLALVFAQTAIAAPSEKAHRPAQPLKRRFVVKDGTYQRE